VQYVRNTDLLITLGKRIRELRLERKLTQDELGFVCNNHGEQIGRIERGELNVSICTLDVISKGLEINLKELLDF